MKRVLVVEDDRFLINVYRVKLSKQGYEVEVALNGVEGKEKLEKFQPDVILLDLVMPKMDGFEFLAYLAQQPQRTKIKVIVTSNLGQPEDRERVMQLGADQYIVKTDTTLTEIIKMIG